jgi:hypothetical protein
LDINTLRALEEGLESFAGCGGYFTTDGFRQNLYTHSSFEGNSEVYCFEGGFSEYEKIKTFGWRFNTKTIEIQN